MAKYKFTKKAIEDLSSIWNYTYQTWSENQADKYYFMLLESCNKIANNPDIGRSYYLILKNLFGFKTGRHIIFYRIIDFENIEIIRILHEKMDFKNRICE